MKQIKLIPIKEFEILDDEMLSFITAGATSNPVNPNCTANKCKANTASCDINDCKMNSVICKSNICDINENNVN